MKGGLGDFVQSVSPDGKVLLYGIADIMTLPLTGEAKPVAYLQTKYSETFATVSPDGRWVAYQSDELGRCVSVCVDHYIYYAGDLCITAGTAGEDNPISVAL